MSNVDDCDETSDEIFEGDGVESSVEMDLKTELGFDNMGKINLNDLAFSKKQIKPCMYMEDDDDKWQTVYGARQVQLFTKSTDGTVAKAPWKERNNIRLNHRKQLILASVPSMIGCGAVCGVRRNSLTGIKARHCWGWISPTVSKTSQNIPYHFSIDLFLYVMNDLCR